jgi:EAL domain-containing protein (putative c-di-GMP-specific phosphodiesterase class I)
MRRYDSADGDEEFDRIIKDGLLDPVFQPIRELQDLKVVGYEALVRGPLGSPYRDPGALLDKAYRTGRVIEFDWAARVSACRAAMAAGLGPGRLLFLNIEPLALMSDAPPDFVADIEAAFATYQIVLEITERSLERDPRSLLAGIDHQRPKVAGLALDDLGTAWEAVSMLPLLSVDVIKLDHAVTQAGASSAGMKTLDIALEESERTGAAILPEGIEKPEHLDFARAIGADLAQGYLLGEPSPLRPEWEADARSWALTTRPVPNVDSPFDVTEGLGTRTAGTDLLVALSRQMAYEGVQLGPPALAMTLVPEPGLLAEVENGHMVDMAARGVVAAALGPGLDRPPALGVRGGPIEDGRLKGQWVVLTLSPETASAMIARRSDRAPSTFDYAVTHERQRVIMAARSILAQAGI